jgi:hypothetical protein
VRLLAINALIVALLASCAGDGSGGDESAPQASASPTTATTLAETCPEVEAKMPKEQIFAEAADWATYADALQRMRIAGDTETKNALDLLIPAVEDLADDPPDGQAKLAADRALIGALNTLADRCAAVGSSALQ